MTLSIVVGGRRALNQEVHSHKKNQEKSSCTQIKRQVAITSRLIDLSTYSIYVMTATDLKTSLYKQ